MKKTYEENELKQLIKGMIKESLGEGARIPRRVFNYLGTLDESTLNEVYRNGAEQLWNCIAGSPAFEEIVQDYLDVNRKELKASFKAQKEKNIEDNEREEIAKSVANSISSDMGTVAEAFTKTGKSPWQRKGKDFFDKWSEENVENPEYHMPNGITYRLQGMVKFPNILIKCDNPIYNITHTGNRGTETITNDSPDVDKLSLCLCMNDGSRNDTNSSMGALFAVVTLSYDEASNTPRVQILNFVNSATYDQEKGIDRGICGLLNYNNFTGKERGKYINFLDGDFNPVQGIPVYFTNFNYEQFRKVCNDFFKTKLYANSIVQDRKNINIWNREDM